MREWPSDKVSVSVNKFQCFLPAYSPLFSLASFCCLFEVRQCKCAMVSVRSILQAKHDMLSIVSRNPVHAPNDPNSIAFK